MVFNVMDYFLFVGVNELMNVFLLMSGNGKNNVNLLLLLLISKNNFFFRV